MLSEDLGPQNLGAPLCMSTQRIQSTKTVSHAYTFKLYITCVHLCVCVEKEYIWAHACLYIGREA